MFKTLISATTALAAGALGYKIAEKTKHEKSAPLVGAVVSAVTYNAVSDTLKEDKEETAEEIPLDPMADFVDLEEEEPQEATTPDETIYDPNQNSEETVTDEVMNEEEIETPVDEPVNEEPEVQVEDSYPDEDMDAPYDEPSEEATEEEPSPIENREVFVNKFIEAAEKGEDAVQQFIEALDTEESGIADSLPAFQNEETDGKAADESADKLRYHHNLDGTVTYKE